MVHGRYIAALAACLVALAPLLSVPRARALAAGSGQGATITANPAPSPEQIHSLLLRVLESQHRNDQALDEFERTEHAVSRKGENGDMVTDLRERHVPSAGGDIKLKLAENGVAVSPELYRQELQFAVDTLNLAMHPDDRYRDAMEKYEKRRHEHAELVNDSAKAFRISWAGSETRTSTIGGHGPRTLLKFLLDPDPNYKPMNRFAASFQHIHAAVWVDEAQAQIARAEGDIATDIAFGGGIAGKVYHGGHIVVEQDEVAPGIWLPTYFNYEVDGRKFLFAFGVHDRTEITNYRRVGPPPQAIEILRNELNNLTAATPSR